MQIDFDLDERVNQRELRFARLVSAGENGIVETPFDMQNLEPGFDRNQHLVLDECGDDLLLFLNITDSRE